MEKEQIYWKLFGKKLISYKKLETGEIIGTGFFNPLLERLRLFTMLILQANFYKNYKTGKWHGKMVSNTFAPPVGSRPQFRALKGLIRAHLLRHPSPIAMTFAVTYRCQCNCIHCSAGNHERRGVPELSTAEAKKLIDDAQKLGITILAFTGGEPLLREDIFELIAHVDKRKAMPIMFTNGQYLTEKNADLLAQAGLYSIFVSVDNPNAQEHDKLRRTPGLFEAALKGLQRMKERGVFVGLSSYATRSGTEVGMYKKLHEFAREIGVHNVILFDGVPTGNLLHDTSELLTLEQREEIHQYSADVFSKKIIPPLSSQSWQNSVEGNLSGIGCLAANIQFYSSAYGDIAPCDFTPLSFGNIREESLKDIWKKMVSHPAYDHRSTCCRMQLQKFRQFYIDPIPDGSILPYDINRLPRVDYRQVKLRQQR